MARYGKKAGDKVEKAMHERKHGTLKSGSGKKVTSKKQAINSIRCWANMSAASLPSPFIARLKVIRSSSRKC